MSPAHDNLLAAQTAIANARSIVIITGAGISAESGIATFRGGESGGMEALWKSFDPQTLATPEAFAENPKVVTEWYDWRRLRCREAIPNAGHLAIAALERRVTALGGSFTLLTQNVDRLHHRAGSRNVVELHGTIMEWRCAATDKAVPLPDGPMPVTPMPSPHYPGAFVRPSVVWFGEALPAEAARAASEAVERCDVFMSIGTSSVVYPAAGFVEIASSLGARTIEVNRELTPISRRVDHSILGRAGEILPSLFGGA